MSMIPSDTTKALIASLVQLATADGNVNPIEAAHIQMLAAKSGIDPGEFDRICAQPSFYTSRSPIGFDDKRAFLAHLIAFVSFDLRIADQEKEYCLQKATQLGLMPEPVQIVFEQIHANGGTLSIDTILASLN